MRTIALATFALLSFTAGCASDTASNKPAGTASGSKKSLFDRLGGKGAITAVVNDFVDLCASDNRINARFVNTDVPHLKAMLVDQICAASGGPCKYTGKDMKTAHTGMNLTSDEFDWLVDDLKKTLDHYKVTADAQADLLGALGPMKPDIVGH